MRAIRLRLDPGFGPCAGALGSAEISRLRFFEAQFHKASVVKRARIASAVFYRFFHPPRCPGAPPVERGEGPNSGPDCCESVGCTILLRSPNGFSGSARVG